MTKEDYKQMTKEDFELIYTLNEIGFLSEGNTFKKDLLESLKRSKLGDYAILQDFATHLINNEVELDLEMLEDKVLTDELNRRLKRRTRND